MNRVETIKSLIKNIPDYPQKGIIFRDITSILNTEDGLELIQDEMYDSLILNKFNKIVAIEARGFILGSILASDFKKPLVLARKPGKLPNAYHEKKYKLEYGEDKICIQLSDIKKGDEVIICDDLIASGGTAKTTCEIVEDLGGKVKICYFLIELDSLGGRKLLEDSGIKVISSIHY